MKLGKAFWDKWTKHNVPYKVMKYACGCSYIFLTDEKCMPIGNHSICPEHRKVKTWVILWCETCGLEIKAKPQSGYRQKRCIPCAGEFLKEYNRLNFKSKYAGRYGNKPKEQKTELQEEKEKDQSLEDTHYLAVARFIKTIKQDLPVFETPILDSYTIERKTTRKRK